MGRTPLILIAFGVLSVLLTAAAAWLAMHRPDVERLDVETRSRLQADYSIDSVARRIEPLNPDIVRAAADDEADLTQQQTSTEPPRRVLPADVTPVATAQPTATPRPGATAPAATTPGATSPPGSTATTAPASTPRPGETPQASATSGPGATPAPTSILPTIVIPTVTVPPLPTLPPLLPTNTPVPPTATTQPTNTPAPTATPTRTPTPAPTLTPTPSPTSIIGAILNSLSCTILGTIGSLPGGGQTTITFVNQSGESVKIFQLPTLILGSPIELTTLQDGDDYTRNTQVGFAFMVTDLDEDCIGIYRAVAGGGTAVID